MRRIIDILVGALYYTYPFLVSLLFTWVCVWGANFVVFVSSIGGDAIVQALAMEGSNFMADFLVNAVTTGFFYFLAVLAGTNIILSYNEAAEREVMLIVLCLLIIAVYDVRVTAMLPEIMQQPIHFMQQTLHFRLTGGIDWTAGTGGGMMKCPVTPGQYAVFDCAVAIVAGIYIYTKADRPFVYGD